MQEVAWDTREWAAFNKAASRAGYNSFFSGTPNQARKGGAAVLVRKHLPSRPAWQTADDGGAAQLVWVGGYLIGSVYLAPNHDSIETCNEISARMLALAPQDAWILGGDFNAEPNENPFMHALQDIGCVFSHPNTPTRWEGHRCIDYFAGNQIWNDPVALDLEVADHKIIQAHGILHVPHVTDWKLAPVAQIPSLSRMNITKDAWFQKVDHVWVRHSRSDPWTSDVSHDWDDLSQRIFAALLETAAEVAPQAVASIPAGLCRKGRPAQPRFIHANWNARTPAGDHATYQEIKLTRHLARLQEVVRLTGFDQEVPRSLWVKIQRSPYFDHGITTHQNIRNVKRKLSECIQRSQKSNLDKWKEAMQEDKAAFAWLRRDLQVASHALKGPEDDTAASSVTEALLKIKQYWKTIWDRQLPDSTETWSAIEESLGPAREMETWPALTGQDLFAAVNSIKGRAAGIDQWSYNDVVLLSPAMWNQVASFVNHCELIGHIPNQWTYIRQLHLDKGKQSDLVSDLRPISVTSVWWRIIGKARYQHQATQDWLSRILPPYVFGGVPGKGIADAMGPILASDASHGWIASLDYAKAFDRVQPHLSCRILRHLGADPKVMTFLNGCWSSQRRWLQFLQHFDPCCEQVSTSLLQGDTWSMLAMTAVLLPAAADIARAYPQSQTILYADDRTILSPSPEELHQVVTCWSQWGSVLGCQEHEAKAQFYHATTDGRRKLVEVGFCPQKVSDRIKVLGYTFQGVQARAAAPAESTRLRKAVLTAAKVRCIPGPLARKIRIGQYVVPTKASFGWLCRRPSNVDIKPYEAAWRALVQKPAQASPFLYKIMRGHMWDLRFLALQTLVSVLLRFATRMGGQLPGRLLSKAGWPRNLKVGLESLGWEQRGTWTFHHGTMDQTLSFQVEGGTVPSHNEACHWLRESWRRWLFDQYRHADRREHRNDPGWLPEYCEERTKKCRSHHFDAHSLAVVTGAFVSPAAYYQMRTNQNQNLDPTEVPPCPFCGLVASEATQDHVAWECPHNGRPVHVTPRDMLERRLGWPISDDACLRWLARVRQAVLDARHT